MKQQLKLWRDTEKKEQWNDAPPNVKVKTKSVKINKNQLTKTIFLILCLSKWYIELRIKIFSFVMFEGGKKK